MKNISIDIYKIIYPDGGYVFHCSVLGEMFEWQDWRDFWHWIGLSVTVHSGGSVTINRIETPVSIEDFVKDKF